MCSSKAGALSSCLLVLVLHPLRLAWLFVLLLLPSSGARHSSAPTAKHSCKTHTGMYHRYLTVLWLFNVNMKATNNSTQKVQQAFCQYHMQKKNLMCKKCGGEKHIMVHHKYDSVELCRMALFSFSTKLLHPSYSKLTIKFPL